MFDIVTILALFEHYNIVFKERYDFNVLRIVIHAFKTEIHFILLKKFMQ